METTSKTRGHETTPLKAKRDIGEVSSELDDGNISNIWGTWGLGCIVVVVVVSFPYGRNESCQSLRQVRLLYDRWQHHLSPPPQFRHGTGGEGNILQSPALVVTRGVILVY
ncbi:hypothetical protein TNCV_2231471 [Trichonephila clavipes]|nr:hypothetical protein TNCV_2231471 [Trichonephila clavipes]